MGRIYILATIIVLIALIIAISFIINSYKKCPPGHVLIINNNKPDNFGNLNKILFSGGAFVWPIVGSYQIFSLAPIPIIIKEDFLASSNQRVKLDIKINIGISTSETVLKDAIDRFSGLNIEQIKEIAEDIISGQLRKVTASVDTNELQDISAYANKITKEVSGELIEIGLKLINLDIKKIERI